MVLILTRSELAQELNVSIETVKKDAFKRGFKETFKIINNRRVKAYELTEDQLSMLKREKGVETGFKSSTESNEPPFEGYEVQPQTLEMINSTIDKILDYSEKHNERLEIYIERALKAEQQQKLIETSEARKDDEINRLNALVKQLQDENTKLKAENEQLKSRFKWNFWKKQKKPDIITTSGDQTISQFLQH